VLLALHLVGVTVSLRRRRDSEAPVVIRAAKVAFGLVVFQLALASSMILLHLPPVLRSLHEATGVGIWLSCFAFAYLARRASTSDHGAVTAPASVRIGQDGRDIVGVKA
jgi:heme A synthase